jgi:RNA polymerase sigma-70 factor (ECF subfamily)
MAGQADIRACIGRACRFAHALVGDAAAGEALVEDVLSRLPVGQPAGGLKLWLLRGVIEAARAARQALSSSESVSPLRGSAVPPASIAEAGSTTQQRVREALAEMNPEEREVLLLVTLEGLSYEELAQVLDVPVDAALSRLIRARQLFATLRSGRAAAGSFLRVVR